MMFLVYALQYISVQILCVYLYTLLLTICIGSHLHICTCRIKRRDFLFQLDIKSAKLLHIAVMWIDISRMTTLLPMEF